jgi:hypothetical protein
VGNSYGAHWRADQVRTFPATGRQYSAIGDPNGLEPVVPNIAPLLDQQGIPLPYIASNDYTVFSVFNTEKGTISSYYFDTCEPESAVVKFDEFYL